MKETETMVNRSRRAGALGGWTLLAVGHGAATLLVAALVWLLVVPPEYVEPIGRRLLGNDEVWQMSTTALLIHLGLAACIWALVVILYKLVMLYRAEGRQRTVRLARGSVMTETLIIMPLFFLLTFGMAQLAVSNIAAILANVAAYEAARAAWIWQPEEDGGGRMGIADGIAVEKCRIAVALVMLPVANGEFFSDPRLPTYASKMRVNAVGAHIPFGGTLTSLDPEISDLIAGAASLQLRVAVRSQQTMPRALDTGSFIRRTATKFTHAFHASGCAINDDHSVTMTYALHIAMPLMGPVFGEKRAPSTNISEFINSGFGDLEGVGGRWGYFSTYTRELGFRKQMLPNPKMPQNELISFDAPDSPSATDLIEQGVNDTEAP